MFYYVYVLKSEVDGQNYVGYTSDLTRRINQHNKGWTSLTLQDS